MKLKIALGIAVAAAVAVAVIPVGLAGPAKSSAVTVRVAQSNLGRILVDNRGRTLYLFAMDTGGKSSCNGACAAAWPPLIASGKPRAKAGARRSLLGRTRRMDGRWQVTYNHHPLYTFYKDTARGQTNGQGIDAFGAKWWAVSPAGAKIVQTDMTGGYGDPSSGYGGSGGYGGW